MEGAGKGEGKSYKVKREEGKRIDRRYPPFPALSRNRGEDKGRTCSTSEQ